MAGWRGRPRRRVESHGSAILHTNCAPAARRRFLMRIHCAVPFVHVAVTASYGEIGDYCTTLTGIMETLLSSGHIIPSEERIAALWQDNAEYNIQFQFYFLLYFPMHGSNTHQVTRV